MIVRWPGVTHPGTSCDARLYQLDLAPTLCELLNARISDQWDGRSFAAALRGEAVAGRDHLVLSTGAWSCQRSVLTDSHLMIRTYHAGLHEWPDVMLYDLQRDPHEVNDLAAARPEVVGQCEHLLSQWWAQQATRPDARPDPMMQMIREGGPLYVRDQVEPYAKLLRQNGREAEAERMVAAARRYPAFRG